MTAGNLRGRPVRFLFQGRQIRGVVITRIRGTKWLIESRDLPPAYERQGRIGRIILERAAFSLAGDGEWEPAVGERVRASAHALNPGPGIMPLFRQPTTGTVARRSRTGICVRIDGRRTVCTYHRSFWEPDN